MAAVDYNHAPPDASTYHQEYYYHPDIAYLVPTPTQDEGEEG